MIDFFMLAKGKRSDNDEWIVGYYVYTDKAYIGTTINTIDVQSRIWYEVEQDSVCRSTGLFDAHQELIFENDIIRAFMDDNGRFLPEERPQVTEDSEVNEIRYRVYWKSDSENCGWGCSVKAIDEIDHYNFYACTQSDCSNSEIIGNAIDQAELLQKTRCDMYKINV